MRARTVSSRSVRTAAALLPGLAILLSACAGGPSPRPGPEPLPEQRVEVRAPEDAADLPLITDLPVFEPVGPPARYREAVNRGTRSETGAPGPDYWQQEVSYEIEVELDPESARLAGSETVRYVNNSPDTLRVVLVHLYQNVFAEGARRNRAVELTGGMELARVAAGGRELGEMDSREVGRRMQAGSAEGGYALEGTIAVVLLPRPLAPGEQTELGFDWSFRVPGEEAFRMGHIDREVFNIAQWYPQIATYDDVRGYAAEPYLGDGEFYLEYGSFDVEITAPEGWLVSATGTLRNPGSVLRPGARSRLERALASDTVIAVVGPSDREAGAATATSEDGTLTWRFSADSVRDFAFAASDLYVWDAVGAEVGGGRDRTLVSALYDPSIEHWGEAARFSRHAVEFFSRYIMPYPYPHATAVYGPVGGMEYPMLVFIGRSEPGEPLYSVLAHEFSHEWFPMVVGSPEAEYAWMDEGLTTFNEALARADFFENEEARASDLEGYLSAARAGVEAPLMRHTDYVPHPYGRVVAAYLKPAVLLHALRATMGEEAFDGAYRRYAEAWSYRHPLPWDFFSMMQSATDRDLDWFWRAWFFETATLDQAVEEVRPGDGSVRITVTNTSDGVMPVFLEIETEGGETRTVRWPAEAWAGTRRISRDVEVPGPIRRVTLDPERLLPDLDRADNEWTR